MEKVSSYSPSISTGRIQLQATDMKGHSTLKSSALTDVRSQRDSCDWTLYMELSELLEMEMIVMYDRRHPNCEKQTLYYAAARMSTTVAEWALCDLTEGRNIV